MKTAYETQYFGLGWVRVNGNSDGNDEGHSNGHAHGTVRAYKFLSRHVTSRLHESNVIFTVN